ncbi:DNA starvation/stationary phase protection protein Dps (plasmid) [Halorarum halophilum]|uniref:DNA starvation/stationary phase protection protein Dps n=2 Tax=Halorarum halophilum TaxID=2743090 RepID=A0A7D5KPS7_9EURY|nr:DNA starvation/stationary phase protection protein Dps [Halobaculum halophilum]
MGQQPGQGQQLSGHEFPTKTHLPPETRRGSIELLNQALVDTTDLLTQVKFAHWNVRGENFFQLHELFEELAEELEEHADEIAERATSLGGQAMATTRIAAATSRLPEMRTDAIRGTEYVELVAERVAIHDANLSAALQAATANEDLDTADLLNEISREVGRYRWFLEAHFITQPTGSEGSVGQQPGIGDQQPEMSGQQPRTSSQQPEMGGQQFGMSEQQPGMGGSQPGMGASQSGMGEPQPGIGESQSGMGGQQSTQQQPPTGVQQMQPPSMDAQVGGEQQQPRQQSDHQRSSY